MLLYLRFVLQSHWLLDVGDLLDSETLGMFVGRWAKKRAISHLVSPEPMVQKGLLIDPKSEHIQVRQL